MPATEHDTILISAATDRGSASIFAACPLEDGAVRLDLIRACVIADAYARFRRARGDEVLFSLGFPRPVGSEEDGAGERREAMRDRLERLGCSCDWDRAFSPTDPAPVRWSQQLFLALLEGDLIYRQDGQWLLRTSRYAEASLRDLETLSGWGEDLIEAQRKALGGIDGIEVDALIVGAGTLSVFTPYPDSIEIAAFVAVSPSHPDVDTLTAQPDVAAQLEWAREAGWWREEKEAKRAPAVATGLHASVPGASTLLPLVISPRVDDRFGVTAVLGIPERDEGDREIAEILEKPAASAWKLTKLNAKPRPGTRYRVNDVVVAGPDSPGTPVPVVHCAQCGVVPLPAEQLEGGAAEAAERECPRCEGSAQRDAAAIEPRFDRLWMWLSLCAPADGSANGGLDGAEAERWLPIDQFVGEPGDDRLLFEQRVMAKMLEDIGKLPPLEGHEPFAGAILPGRIGADGGVGELVEGVEPDVARLAIFVAAAPQTSFTWSEEPVRYSTRVLAELRTYAEPRLRDWPAPEDGIDGSTKWRRRLSKWCRIATDKITTSLERLEMQRAGHNALLLFTRIKDFEARAANDEGELEASDREAVVEALLVLLRLLAPFVPRTSEELLALAGDHLAEPTWPTYA